MPRAIKFLAARLLAVTAASLVGCSVHELELLEPVGPAPIANLRAPSHGFLRVRTPTEQDRDDDVFFFPHQAFSIYSLDGRLAKWVRNADSARDETPAVTPLPVGVYKIRSWTQRSGIVTVTVVIERGRTTDIYLDGSFEGTSTASHAYVTLPTGEIVGWRSTDSGEH